MKIRDWAYETASALAANRGRSLLTILGIAIGIAAVIAMSQITLATPMKMPSTVSNERIGWRYRLLIPESNVRNACTISEA